MTTPIQIEAQSIRLLTDIPGPRARQILARRRSEVSSGLGYATPIVPAKAHGALIEDVDGNVVLDFAGGVGALTLGHSPRCVVEAVQAQAETLIHLCEVVGTTDTYVRLCERLNQLVPISGKLKSILDNTGAEVVETAVRAARCYTGRPAVIGFDGAYHGRSHMAMSLTSSYSYKKGLAPLASDVYHAPFPYLFRRVPELSEERYIDMTIEAFDRTLLTQIGAESVAAIVIEPVQGEGGFLPTPKRFMKHIAKRCTEFGIVLVIDEVQTGFGRTGTLFAIEQFDVEPDILICAKSIAAGMPLSAMTGRAEILDAVQTPGYGGTYSGNPLSCAAALASIDYILSHKLPERAVHLGNIIRQEMTRWQSKMASIGDVRGLGAMLGMELVLANQEPATKLTSEVIAEAARRGLMLFKAGIYNNCIRLAIPLTIEESQLNEGLEVLHTALQVTINSQP